MSYKRDEDCIFCKILEGDIPSKKVYEDDSFIGILDVNPANRGHVIIIPKNHAANVFELPQEDAAKIFVVAKKIATAINEAFHPDGVNILQNNGVAAGQTVFHLHVHVIPRYDNDTVNIIWEQKNMMDELEDIKNEIGRYL